MSICSIEDVARATDKPFWFQLYIRRDLEFSKRLIDRAKAAGCSALFVTVDLAVLSQRHKDLRNGLSAPPKLTVPNILNMATKPAWCLGMLRTRNRGFGNIVGHVEGIDNIWKVAAWAARQHDVNVTWDDIKWIRDRWGGKLVIKGILDPEDAVTAAGLGVDAMIVSNHGGRQLDGAHSAIAMLPRIADAVAGRCEILFDSGIRTGHDVLRALALGASGTFIGRPWLYGLGAAGPAGVERALEILRKELDQAMALCGIRDIREAGPGIIAENPFAAGTR